MAFQIVLLSGTVASGKTTLWQQLKRQFPERAHPCAQDEGPPA